ncbi:efflux RND transporter periplasmic adaptor subunit [Halodesulfovibrio marinisediminis]|uniref:Membrane fusion protein, multidrug efflux system n=1 Tax=Halodesulfovibrio marinisediminis DSM 17456 TaxID=1121457 RepID=A0A1N6GVN1_9BACT|nr:efflux RND transporter periplasmic adaptor subunit [Halodesulfovibrio marinisediminis]SIO11425.1 membrane fusion protein, multidrug efflux system [Halodesulfovibrio marinisediminis DSM 17456]
MGACYHQRIFSIAVSCICVFILTACSGNGDQPQPIAPNVDVISVYEVPVANRWEAVGRVDSKDIVQIKSRVEGFLIERDFVEGDIVAKDKVLFKIDPRPFEADLQLAKANVEKTQAALIEAKQNLQRGAKLYAGKNISKSELDAYTSTERQAAAEVDAAKAQVYAATINLGYTTISAPLRGRIGRTIYSVGNLISPSSGTLATIYSIDPIYVYFTIDEKDMVTYRAKWGYRSSRKVRFTLKLPNGAMYPLEGQPDFAQPFVDKDTGTIEVRCIFPNPDNLLLSGMYVAVIMEDAEKKPMPVIPQSCVQQGQSGYSVMVVDKNNIASSRKVELGMRLNAMWVVMNGLQAGERIVVEGLQKIQQGKPVTPHIVTFDPKTGVITKDSKQDSKKTQEKPAKASPSSSVAPQKTGSEKNIPENPRWTKKSSTQDTNSSGSNEQWPAEPVPPKSSSSDSPNTPSTSNSGS